MAVTARKSSILVVDDEPSIGQIFTDFLGGKGYDVSTAINGREALDRLDRAPYDLIITDLEMPEMNGIELLRELAERPGPRATLMMTSFATVDSAIEAMKIGAFDYIIKPFRMSEVTLVIERALEHLRLRSENIELRQSVQLYQITERFSASLEVPEILRTIVEVLRREMDADLVALRLRDAENPTAYNHLYIQPEDFPSLVELRESFNLFEALKKHRVGEPVITHGAEGLRRFFSRLEFHRPLESFMSVPLRTNGEILGLLNAYSFTRGRRFTEGQRRFLYLMADRAAGALERSLRVEEMKRMFSDTIEGLTSALEAKDHYTRGHSERVGNYSRLIGVGFGLPDGELDWLYHAGRLHDIGKIGMKLDMINKPGPLDRKELSTFRQHPVLGREILAPIKFLEPIVPMVYYHHERWEGNGYPEGLSFDQIPFGARVVCVADSFDVMTSDRPYRRRLKLDAAVSELKRCAGTQFDPQVVDVFLRQLEISHYHELLR